MKAVIAENLEKVFPLNSAKQNKKALDNISFEIEQGEIFGFLGPNGAGKTTTVKILNGIINSSAGHCQVLDIDPQKHPAKLHEIAGVITEHAQMYDNLTGLQNLIFYGTVFGLTNQESKNYAKELLNQLELSSAKNQKLATYSTGMRQRLSLARAMIHKPKILFLDEPTAGLDPESTQSVNLMIKNLAQNTGTTIFLCTHQLRYAQEICSSYGLIDDGQLLAMGNLDELRALVFSGLTVNIITDFTPTKFSYKKTGEKNFEIKVQSAEEIPQIINYIVQNNGNIYHVSASQLSLEDIYFNLIKKDPRQLNKGRVQ